MRLYEAFVLLDSAIASKSLSSIQEEIQGLIEKYGGRILRSGVWGERKLAYEIQGVKRGTYLLYYFYLDPAKVADLRREFILNERILRVMILKEERSEEEIMQLDSLEDRSEQGKEEQEREEQTASAEKEEISSS